MSICDKNKTRNGGYFYLIIYPNAQRCNGILLPNYLILYNFLITEITLWSDVALKLESRDFYKSHVKGTFIDDRSSWSC